MIASRLENLQASPGWASSGDVRKLLNTTVTKQKKPAPKTARSTPKCFLPGALEAGFATLLPEKAAKGAPKPSFADPMR